MGTSEPNSFDQKISESKLRLLKNQNSITIIASNLGVPSIVSTILLFLGNTNLQTLGIWFAFGIVLCIIRTLHQRKLQKFESIDRPLDHWEYELIVLSVISGFYWASSGILFLDPTNPAQSVVLIAAQLGVMAGAVPALASHSSIFFTFVLSTWVPAAAYYYSLNESFFYAIAAIGTFFVIVIISFSVSQRKTVNDSLRLRYENIELLEELRIQKQKAEDASLAKTRFLAVASHDLRQPIHAIRLFTDSLALRATDESSKSIMGMLSNSIDTLSSLFGSLLDMSKLEAQAIEPQIERLDIGRLLENLYAEFAVQCSDKGLRSACRCQPNLFVQTDPVLLERILRNLIWNAIKYTSEGGILLAARKRGDQVRLEIWDTGCGIPTEETPKIFEEFHQVYRQEHEAREGIGLGLSIVNRLCDLLEYDISLRSEIDHGSVFFVEMPLLPILEEGPGVSTSEEEQRKNTDTDLARVQVLVVDDEEDIRTAMCHLLEEWGCTSFSAESADQAVLALDNFTPDLILTDFHLRNSPPGDKVIELVHETLGYDIPGIIITGDTSAEHLRSGNQNAYELLHKPIDTQELRQSMIRALNDQAAVSEP